MTVNPGAGAIEGPTERSGAPAGLDKLARAYIATYHGPHGDAPVSDTVTTGPLDMSAAGKLMSPNLLSAHYKLGRRRRPGETLVEVYPSNDPGGFGPAIQIVTDYATLLMDSVTVLLHRLGVAYKAIMNPILRVRRGPAGELLDIRPSSEADNSREAIDEAWIHVQLSSSVDPRVVAEAKRLLPGVLADARQVALDSRALSGTLLGLANELDTDPEGRFPAADRKDVAALLRWLADGNFVLLGYQRCPVQGGHSSVDPSSRLGVLRFREEILPQLTDSDDLLVLAQATIPSFLRYGAYPYIVVIREHPGHQAIEHRFVGLFTVA
ncbi:MAG: NAD-glutamate dehydrogenase, partial [Mycobacterium sp.]